MVPFTRLQNGHWKSDHSTIVMSASSEPFCGSVFDTGILKTSLSSAGLLRLGRSLRGAGCLKLVSVSLT